jgi:hypothetical protein
LTEINVFHNFLCQRILLLIIFLFKLAFFTKNQHSSKLSVSLLVFKSFFLNDDLLFINFNFSFILAFHIAFFFFLFKIRFDKLIFFSCWLYSLWKLRATVVGDVFGNASVFQYLYILKVKGFSLINIGNDPYFISRCEIFHQNLC